jgi:hypothetical protein
LPEGNGDVVKEVAVAADRSKWPADDADKIEAEYREVLIFCARR